MPTLHLPAAHTDTDVALATELAHVIGSHELFVTWTHGEGPGLPPEVQTLTPDDASKEISPFAELIVAMVHGISAVVNAFLRPPSTRPELPAPRDDRGAPRSADAEPTP